MCSKLLAFTLALTLAMVALAHLIVPSSEIADLVLSDPVASLSASITPTDRVPNSPTMALDEPTHTLEPISTSAPSSLTVIATTTDTPVPTSTPVAEILETSSPTPTPISIPAEGRFILVDQSEQMIHIYENGVEIRIIPCSTGLPESDKYTPAWTGVVGEYWGTFFAYGVYADDAWYLFKSQGSILIHSAPYTLVDGEKVYQDLDLLGVKPASHGCIRIHPDDARWFTAWGPEGVPIVITPPEWDGSR